jgi:8-oxo-dGTP pyrophosphatase MutT (NUDIX family)
VRHLAACGLVIEPGRGRDGIGGRTVPGGGGIVMRPGATPDADCLLMVRQVRAHGVRWEIPGGNQEPAETLEQTAAREVAEECGILVDVGALVCTYLLVRSTRLALGAYFLATALDPGGEPRTTVPDEILEAAYVDPAALDPESVGPVTREVIAQWWPVRRAETSAPFHVAVGRTPGGYRRL